MKSTVSDNDVIDLQGFHSISKPQTLHISFYDHQKSLRYHIHLIQKGWVV